MFCTTCGQKNPDHANYCFSCGRSLKTPGKSAGKPSIMETPWVNVLGISALFGLGMAGIYLHPMLEVAAVAYIAVAASTIWVYRDSARHQMSKWPWTVATLALWALAFPAYLWKTRRWRGLIPGATMAVFVVGLQAFPNLYSANKHFRRGVIFAGQQKLTRAEDEFKKALQKNPDLGEAQ
ncbi:MAG: zinc-ribbon domain-containing protein, partial [Elusimicrobia bacterium]|nr:zinc-ribbon domain-containing protein [Elusimicrobiota bacterium]